ncbi:branched-chain amino acid ABC transporter substrate-binding protein, partial [Bacillus sp. SIMBA_069]
MKKQKTLSILAATVALGSVLAGCGGGQSTAPAQNSGGGSATPAPSQSGGGSGATEKLVIAVVGPMSGQYSDYGSTAKAGAEYALKEKQEAFKQLGFDVQLLAQDD